MLFSLIQLVIVYQEVNIIVINHIILVNTSVAVIGVVFATVWAGSGTWAQERSESQAKEAGRVGEPAISALMFQSRGNVGGRTTISATDSSDVDITYSHGGLAFHDGRVKGAK